MAHAVFFEKRRSILIWTRARTPWQILLQQLLAAATYSVGEGASVFAPRAPKVSWGVRFQTTGL